MNGDHAERWWLQAGGWSCAGGIRPPGAAPLGCEPMTLPWTEGSITLVRRPARSRRAAGTEFTGRIPELLGQGDARRRNPAALLVCHRRGFLEQAVEFTDHAGREFTHEHAVVVSHAHGVNKHTLPTFTLTEKEE